MPAAGGGLEIAPESIGIQIHLFSPSIQRGDVAGAIHKGARADTAHTLLARFSPRIVAKAYLAVDAQFELTNMSLPEVCSEP